MTQDFYSLQSRYEEFIDARDWRQFHTPKNVATSISIEAAELLELFQWHDNLDSSEIAEDEELIRDVEDEIADILIYQMSMAIQLDIDLLEAVEQKLDTNDDRFDLETAESIRNELEGWHTE